MLEGASILVRPDRKDRVSAAVSSPGAAGRAHRLSGMRALVQISPEQVLSTFADWDLEEERKIYLRYHYRRYAVLLEWVSREVAARGHRERLRVLDIGTGYQTQLFRQLFPDAVVDTLGIEDTTFPGRPGEQHIPYDLNDSSEQERQPPHRDGYDIVVMAEVLEHLYTAPELVLKALRQYVRGDGVLLLQTPNGIALKHRLRLLLGRHPYEMIRVERNNPGHFREYTAAELRAIAARAGFRISRLEAVNYFSDPARWYGAYNRVCSHLPETFRDGITATLEPLAAV